MRIFIQIVAILLLVTLYSFSQTGSGRIKVTDDVKKSATVIDNLFIEGDMNINWQKVRVH